jgi:diketogulonate reductase-like aldo/keto reductase
MSLTDSQPTATLNNGVKIPLCTFGTWHLYGDDVGKAVDAALRAGYRHIDCAAAYGNEPLVGKALRKAFNEKIVKREDLFITTKLWCTEWDRAEAACRKSLEDLQLDYLDLYLVHVPVCMERTYSGVNPKGDAASALTQESPQDKEGILRLGKTPYHVVWQQMEGLVAKKLVRSIGVSNLAPLMMADLLTYAKIPPAVNQVEVNPYYANAPQIEFCRKRGIHITGYAALAGGLPAPMGDSVIRAIAFKHSVSPAQVMIRWGIQQGISCIAKAADPAKIKMNANVLGFELSEEEMLRISALNRDRRYCDLGAFHGFPFPMSGY